MDELDRLHYPTLDADGISQVLFYPRSERGYPDHGGYERLQIPLEGGAVLGGRFHGAGEGAGEGKGVPNILFFHGNGEIVADYDDIAGIFNRMGIHFIPVDYRGYGASTGRPTFSAMMQDAQAAYGFLTSWLKERGYGGPLVVMGRSLGSAPAVDIAFRNPEAVAGLIIESGFSRILPLLSLMGIEDPAITEEDGPLNARKIRRIAKPTLIIHAEYDQIIPFAEGEELYEASGSAGKRLLKIPNAGHNDIFQEGMEAYLEAVREFMERIDRR